MRLRHHVPPQAYRPEPVTWEYQSEVDRSSRKAKVLYEAAQRRLERAELRLAAARAKAPARRAANRHQHELQVALELVELRREELQRLEALMKGIPASVEHRGRGAYHPIPQPGGLV